MDIYTKENFELKKQEIMKRIKRGDVFIYPTDTVYGIGCSALDEDAVEKVREIKNNYFNPWSVIAPGKKWIVDNFQIDGMANPWLSKLPGPYTLILNIKNKEAIVQEVNLDKESVGIRIPDNFFGSFVEELGIPVVTTSANVSKEKTITDIADLKDDMKEKVDFMIVNDKKLDGSPSTLIDLSHDKIVIKKR